MIKVRRGEQRLKPWGGTTDRLGVELGWRSKVQVRLRSVL